MPHLQVNRDYFHYPLLNHARSTSTQATLNIQNLFHRTSSIHRYATRSSTSPNFFIKSSRIDIQKHSFSRVGAKVWNEIPEKIKTLPKNCFKKEMKKILFDILRARASYTEIEKITVDLKNHWENTN